MSELILFAAHNPHEEWHVEGGRDDIDAARMGLIGAVVPEGDCPGHSIIDTSRLLIGLGDNPRYHQLLMATLASCSAVFAVVQEGGTRVASIVTAAQVIGVPVVMWRPSGHPSLLGPNTWQFTDLNSALERIRQMEFKPRETSVAKAVLDAGAQVPARAHDSDAGFDLVYNGTESLYIESMEVADVPCGVSVEWPPNVWGLLLGRSSSFRNRGLLVNPAVIDPGFRGELFAIVRNIGPYIVQIEPGERVAQIVPLPALAPKIEMHAVDSLSSSDRGRKGFGSSGK